MFRTYYDDPYKQGMDDGSLGRTKLNPSHFKTIREYDTYLNAYVYSNVMGRHIADTRQHLETITGILLRLFYDYFILRLPYIFPALLIMYLFHKIGVQGSGLVILSVIFAVPTSIVLYYYYLYLRGKEFAYAMLGKGNSRLFYALCFFTTLVSSSLYLFLMSGIISWGWVFTLLYGYATWRLVKIVTDYHWNDELPLKWYSKSKYFGKGVASVLRDDPMFHKNTSLKILPSKEIPRRKSAIQTVKIVSFIILLHLIPLYAFLSGNVVLALTL